MSRLFVNLLLILVVTMTGACGPIHTDELSGTSWYAVQIGDLTPAEDIRSTISFTDGKFTGKGACNTVDGSYITRDQGLLHLNVYITLVSCMEGREQEKAFTEALGLTTAYRVEGQLLYLLDAEGQIQVEMAPIQPAQISGPIWQLAQINNQGAISSLPAGVEISAQFVDQRIFGSAGCNQYFADYRLLGDRLSFSGIGSTKMFCGEPEGVMDQEALFFQALEKAARFEIREQSLTVFDAEGVTLLQFSSVR